MNSTPLFLGPAPDRSSPPSRLSAARSKDFEKDPRTWKIDDLVASAASGSCDAILDPQTKPRAETLIRTRQRIHAGECFLIFQLACRISVPKKRETRRRPQTKWCVAYSTGYRNFLPPDRLKRSATRRLFHPTRDESVQCRHRAKCTPTAPGGDEGIVALVTPSSLTGRSGSPIGTVSGWKSPQLAKMTNRVQLPKIATRQSSFQRFLQDQDP
jgi:hypothetical protein